MAEPLPSPPEPNVRPTSVPSETTGLPSNIAAGLANIFPLIGGVTFLVIERKDAFVRFYAMQSVMLSVVFLLVCISVEMVNFIFSRIPFIGTMLGGLMETIYFIFSLVWFAFYVVSVVRAFSGREWEIPFLGKIARGQLQPRAV